MEPDRWRKVERLYHEALERPQAERVRFLKDACANDEELRHTVESLLAGSAAAEEFLEIPAAELAASALAGADDIDADILGRLRAALAERYVIDRELGRGGMARVYLAQDLKHKRQVGIKVLRPDVAAAIGAGRFLREIAITARLSHPHILPLHDSGQVAGFLYYVMPYVPGESLRVRLERDRQLPLDDALQIAREVADALAYAHSLGIVHRDIKPENILVASGHAVVADFGIARALTVAGRDTFTGTGIVIGTPAYMSPEQASGSEQLDARSDVYSVGCVLYEMLAGEAPFTGPSAQAVLAAQVTATPKPLLDLRRDTPPGVADAIARALAKDPNARFQTAAEFRDTVGPLGVAAAGRRGHPMRVAALYGLAAVAVFGVSYGLTMRLGLPIWVIWGAALLLLVGLPIVIATELLERRRAVARATGIGAWASGGISRWFTWRWALTGGGVAFSALGLGTAGYMAMRLLGIGPLGTLIAAGTLENRERVILADFENHASDSTLGRSLTEAFRVDLSESPAVRLLDPGTIADALRRAARPVTTQLDAALAPELAQRENVKAVVRGEIDPVGRGYVLSASMIAAADGRVLAAVRETAEDDERLMGAVDRLSRRLRERIGESLKSIRASEPLEQVTTGSLEALRKYSEGVRAQSAGDWDHALAAYREATAIDTGFAMAYRKVAFPLFMHGNDLDSAAAAAATQAFRHRDRLPDIERFLTIASYYETADYDWQQVVSAYRSVLERDPDNTDALTGLSSNLRLKGFDREAETLALRAMNVHSQSNQDIEVPAALAAGAQVNQGRYEDALATLDRVARVTPHSPQLLLDREQLEAGHGDYAGAERILRQLSVEQRGSAAWQAHCSDELEWLDEARGKLVQAGRELTDLMAASERRGRPSSYLEAAIHRGLIDVRYRHRTIAGLKAVEGALHRHPLSSMPAWDRPYPTLAGFYAEAGRPDVARRLLTEYNTLVPERIRRGHPERLAVPGAIALAEGRVQDAILAYRAWMDELPSTENMFELAMAYERAGLLDSALAAYERGAAEPRAGTISVLGNAIVGAYGIPVTLQRLGRLYEARGDHAKALEYYGRFVDLWKDADPELQPIVANARAALERLSAEPQ